jgi:hypothetical protein
MALSMGLTFSESMPDLAERQIGFAHLLRRPVRPTGCDAASDSYLASPAGLFHRHRVATLAN